ncbi:MAG: ABC-type transporter, periplasmic subunit [Thermomicrobiales bacterium]|nr:ABC-type transporter, periplasmic subunit [Thermomicrobiales bacterium]
MTGRDRSPVPSHLRRVAMSPLTRRNVFKSGVAIGAGALAASTPLQVIYAAAQDDSAQLTLAVEADPSTLDPHVNSNTRDSIFFHALFDRLIERSPDGNLFPGLATEWSVADDNVTWTLALRDDVTFQDGTPFNAEAVVFNLDRIVNPDTKSEYAVFQLGPYESSRAVDEYTVEITMSEPYGPLPVSLATYALSMVSPTAAEATGETFGQNPVGSGPFKFVEWVPQNQVVIERNADYNWASEIHPVSGPAQLARLTFRPIVEPATRGAALFAGEVDIAILAASDFAALEGDSNYRQETILTEGYPPAGLFVNTQRPPTDDVLVRQALAFGVNRDEVNQVVYEGASGPADSVVSTFSWAYDPATALYNYDPERAGQLLDEAGWTMGDAGVRQKGGEDLTIVHLALTSVKQVAELVQAQLKDIGVNVELLVQDNPAQQQSAQQGLHNLVWTQWSGVDPADLRKVYGSENIGDGWNFSHYDNPELDAMFLEGAALNDVEERKAVYARVTMLLMEDATFIPLNNRTVFMGVKANVRGTDVIDERGSMPRIYNASIEG